MDKWQGTKRCQKKDNTGHVANEVAVVRVYSTQTTLQSDFSCLDATATTEKREWYSRKPWQ